MTKIYCLLVILTFTFLSSANAAKKIKVACVGDSITYGYGLADRNRSSYPAMLQEILGKDKYSVKNFGFSGATLLNKGDRPYIKQEAYKKALAFRADYVFIKLGTNDTKLQNWSHKKDFVANYGTLIKSFRRVNAKTQIILLTSLPSTLEGRSISGSRIQNELLPLIEKAAIQNDSALLDLHRSFNPLHLSDKVHPNAFGAEHMAKRVHEYISREYAKKYSVETQLKKQGIKFKKSLFHTYTMYTFQYKGRLCRIVAPHKTNNKKGWIWRARFWGHEPQLDISMLERGFHVVYCDVANLFGSPTAVQAWDHFYELTQNLEFSPKGILEGMSRGGLIVFNWAAKNPKRVSAIYADAPVMSIQSWPGGKGSSKGHLGSWEVCKKAYHLTEKQATSYKKNPLDKLSTLAKAKVPILFVCGMVDKVVPFSENAGIAAIKYKQLGGVFRIIRKDKVGHHPHSLKNPWPIIKHLLRWSKFKINYANKAVPAAEFRRGAAWGGGTWWNQLDNINKLVAENKGKTKVVFLGDSISQSWTGAHQRLAQKGGTRTIDRYFAKYDALSMGISGDRTEHLIYRTENGHFKYFSPKVIVLMIGVNNIYADRYVGEEVANGIKELVKRLRENTPKSQIILHGPFASGKDADSYRRQQILTTHKNIKELGKIKNVHYMPLFQKMIKKDGSLDYKYMRSDNIHLKPFAYEFWAKEVDTKIKEIIE